MIRLNCFITVDERHRAQVLEAARRLTAASLTHDGCIAYDIFESATRHDVLMICETWRDARALAAHGQTDEFKREVPAMKAIAQFKTEQFEF